MRIQLQSVPSGRISKSPSWYNYRYRQHELLRPLRPETLTNYVIPHPAGAGISRKSNRTVLTDDRFHTGILVDDFMMQMRWGFFFCFCFFCFFLFVFYLVKMDLTCVRNDGAGW